MLYHHLYKEIINIDNKTNYNVHMIVVMLIIKMKMMNIFVQAIIIALISQIDNSERVIVKTIVNVLTNVQIHTCGIFIDQINSAGQVIQIVLLIRTTKIINIDNNKQQVHYNVLLLMR